MDSFQINGTNETPNVLFDKFNGVFEISGRSLSEKPDSFYLPVINWIKAYAPKANDNTMFSFKFEYLNTASSKSILDVLNAIESVKGARVVWYFNDEDEDMEEIGEELAELVKVPFEFKSY